MPGIDFTRLRGQVALAQLLDRVGFTATTRHGPPVRGPCPVHGSAARRSRSCAAQWPRNYRPCFRCSAGGNPLDLYRAVTKLPVYGGALELCARLSMAAPRRGAALPVGPDHSGRHDCLPDGARPPP